MWIMLKPQTPLVVGGIRSDSYLLSGLSTVPGRVLRGVWAEQLLKRGFSTEQVVSTVEKVQFGNLFPTALWGNVLYTLPLPLTAGTCKRAGGFSSSGGGRKRHGVVDTLLPQMAYVSLQMAGARFAYPFNLECHVCGHRMEPLMGFYTVYQDGKNHLFCLVELRYHGQTKVALSKDRRASFEGMLYTVSAVSPVAASPQGEGETPLVFLGRVKGDEETVREMIEAVSGASLGSLHTRGYGKIEIEEFRGGLPDLSERLENFNGLFKMLWKDLRRLAVNPSQIPEEPEGIYFSLDLLAPGVFADQDGVPGLVPLVEVNGEKLEPFFWRARSATATGWSIAWGLPKPTNLAACTGSVYAFCWKGNRDELLRVLSRMEEAGVGFRRDESFGEALVCHPFHLEVEER